MQSARFQKESVAYVATTYCWETEAQSDQVPQRVTELGNGKAVPRTQVSLLQKCLLEMQIVHLP